MWLILAESGMTMELSLRHDSVLRGAERYRKLDHGVLLTL